MSHSQRILAWGRSWLFRLVPFLERQHALRQFVKFCIVGVSNVVLDFVVYIILTRFFNIYYLLANAGSFLVAVTWSFFLNKNWTFRARLGENVREKYIKFFAANVVGIIIQTLLFYMFVEKIHMHDLLGKAASIVLVVFWNFTFSKYWVFKIR